MVDGDSFGIEATRNSNNGDGNEENGKSTQFNHDSKNKVKSDESEIRKLKIKKDSLLRINKDYNFYTNERKTDENLLEELLRQPCTSDSDISNIQKRLHESIAVIQDAKGRLYRAFHELHQAIELLPLLPQYLSQMKFDVANSQFVTKENEYDNNVIKNLCDTFNALHSISQKHDFLEFSFERSPLFLSTCRQIDINNNALDEEI